MAYHCWMDITLLQLRVLREVDRQGTIVSAAESLGYTPSALSQQLANMERAVGSPVLEKVGRNVSVTEVGKVLVRHAVIILDQLEKAKADVEMVEGEVAGTLKVGLLSSVSARLLVPIMERIRDRYPEMTIRTFDSTIAASLGLVHSGEVDLCITADNPFAPNPGMAGLERKVILHDWFRLAVPSGSMGSPMPPVADHKAMSGKSLIGPMNKHTCGVGMARICRENSFDVEIVHESCDYPAVLNMVGAGLGMAFVPDLALYEVPDNVDIINLKKSHCRTIEASYRSTSAERGMVQAFVRTAIEVAGELGMDLLGESIPDSLPN